MLVEFVILVCLAFMLLASAADLKTGEVPEKHSMGLLGFILSVAALDSIASWSLSPLLESVLWGLIAFLASYAIYWLGHWGGGDVKLTAGVGCILGWLGSAGYQWPGGTFMGWDTPPLVTYAVDMAALSTPYVLAYTLVLGLLHPGAFTEYLKRLRRGRTAVTIAFSTVPLMLASYLGLYALAAVYSLVPLLALASVYMKSVEESVLTKTIKASELKDWDILADDIVSEGVKIASKGVIEGITPSELGEVRRLLAEGKLPETVRVKWGVKFVPVLFLALPATLWAGNLLDAAFRLVFTR